MNFWLVVSVLISIGLTATYASLQEKDFNENLTKMAKYLHPRCNLIVGISDEEIAAMRDGKFDQFDEKTTERLKGYITCLWIVSNVMSVDLELNPEMVRMNMPESLKNNGPDMYADCLKNAKSSKSNAHDAIWDLTKCVYAADPEDFIMF